MTLHWWMHWFWVTSLLLLVCSSWAYPQSDELQHMTTSIDPLNIPTGYRPNERRGKAMYPQSKPMMSSTSTIRPPVETPAGTMSKLYLESLADRRAIEKPILQDKKNLERVEQIKHTELNDTILKPQVNQSVSNISADLSNASVVPISIDNDSEISTEMSQNVTSLINETTRATANLKDNLTRHEPTAGIPIVSDLPIKEIEEFSETDSRIVTEKPLSLETTVLEKSNQPSLLGISASRPRSLTRSEDQLHQGGMDAGAIAGISFAALALAALAGTTAFVLYRRRYLNKPQTLNDKCSNPDSSGYLDDSTIRENSEEMYSLDNDSFLNSLEAMTIQNYWTDSVKHTKL